MLLWETPTPETIENERQNKPSYVVELLQSEVPAWKVYDALLRCGVFKWFRIRRELIALKDDWRHRLTSCYQILKMLSRGEMDTLDNRSHDWWKGYTYCLENRRREIRELCHSPRWSVQDNDRGAKAHLQRRTKEAETVSAIRKAETERHPRRRYLPPHLLYTICPCEHCTHIRST